jgi:hypothetical protein
VLDEAGIEVSPKAFEKHHGWTQEALNHVAEYYVGRFTNRLDDEDIS